MAEHHWFIFASHFAVEGLNKRVTLIHISSKKAATPYSYDLNDCLKYITIWLRGQDLFKTLPLENGSELKHVQIYSKPHH